VVAAATLPLQLVNIVELEPLPPPEPLVPDPEPLVPDPEPLVPEEEPAVSSFGTDEEPSVPPPDTPPPETTYYTLTKEDTAPRLEMRRALERLEYPQAAWEAGVEGIVYLELDVDETGSVRAARVLLERPAGMGFGEAAVKALAGFQGLPALSPEGAPIAVKYRCPVRFTVTGRRSH
jgi:TonB family protein